MLLNATIETLYHLGGFRAAAGLARREQKIEERLFYSAEEQSRHPQLAVDVRYINRQTNK